MLVAMARMCSSIAALSTCLGCSPSSGRPSADGVAQTEGGSPPPPNPGTTAPDTGTALPDASMAGGGGYASLAAGRAETVVGGIAGAEDLLFTADGQRLFVTANSGVYELVRDPSGQVSATNLHAGESCSFTGIVQVQTTLYSACAGAGGGNSFLFAASLAAAPAMPSFRKIYTITGTQLANEVAVDENHRIYVAASFQGKIVRLQLSTTDPFTVSGQADWFSTAGPFPNGLRYVDSGIYWTDSQTHTIGRIPILPDGSPGSALSFDDPGAGALDDLYVDGDGTILVTSFNPGQIGFYGPLPAGMLIARTTPGTFVEAADVLPANGRLGFRQNDLLVTDKNPGSVVALHLPP